MKKVLLIVFFSSIQIKNHYPEIKQKGDYFIYFFFEEGQLPHLGLLISNKADPCAKSEGS